MLIAPAQKLFPSLEQLPEKPESMRFREDRGYQTPACTDGWGGTTQSRGGGFQDSSLKSSSSSRRPCSHRLTAYSPGMGHGQPCWVSGQPAHCICPPAAHSSSGGTVRVLFVTCSARYRAHVGSGAHLLKGWTRARRLGGDSLSCLPPPLFPLLWSLPAHPAVSL